MDRQDQQHATEDSTSSNTGDGKGGELGQVSAQLGELLQLIKLRRKSQAGA